MLTDKMQLSSVLKYDLPEYSRESIDLARGDAGVAEPGTLVFITSGGIYTTVATSNTLVGVLLTENDLTGADTHALMAARHAIVDQNKLVTLTITAASGDTPASASTEAATDAQITALAALGIVARKSA